VIKRTDLFIRQKEDGQFGLPYRPIGGQDKQLYDNGLARVLQVWDVFPDNYSSDSHKLIGEPTISVDSKDKYRALRTYTHEVIPVAERESTRAAKIAETAGLSEDGFDLLLSMSLFLETVDGGPSEKADMIAKAALFRRSYDNH